MPVVNFYTEDGSPCGEGFQPASVSDAAAQRAVQMVKGRWPERRFVSAALVKPWQGDDSQERILAEAEITSDMTRAQIYRAIASLERTASSQED